VFSPAAETRTRKVAGTVFAARNLLEDVYAVGCVGLNLLLGWQGYESLFCASPDLTGDAANTPTPPVWALLRVLAAQPTPEATQCLVAACACAPHECQMRMWDYLEQGAAVCGLTLAKDGASLKRFAQLVDAIQQLVGSGAAAASVGALGLLLLSAQCMYSGRSAAALLEAWTPLLWHTTTLDAASSLLPVRPTPPAPWQVQQLKARLQQDTRHLVPLLVALQQPDTPWRELMGVDTPLMALVKAMAQTTAQEGRSAVEQHEPQPATGSARALKGSDMGTGNGSGGTGGGDMGVALSSELDVTDGAVSRRQSSHAAQQAACAPNWMVRACWSRTSHGSEAQPSSSRTAADHDADSVPAARTGSRTTGKRAGAPTRPNSGCAAKLNACPTVTSVLKELDRLTAASQQDQRSSTTPGTAAAAATSQSLELVSSMPSQDGIKASPSSSEGRPHPVRQCGATSSDSSECVVVKAPQRRGVLGRLLRRVLGACVRPTAE
jgi:hypothetical protein